MQILLHLLLISHFQIMVKNLKKRFRNIHPLKVELQNENHRRFFFLDLGIKTGNNKTFYINLYDKQDGFLFSIVRIPYLCCNISSTIFYSERRAEILRIARTTSTCNEFRTSSKPLVNRAQN